MSGETVITIYTYFPYNIKLEHLLKYIALNKKINKLYIFLVFTIATTNKYF